MTLRLPVAFAVVLCACGPVPNASFVVRESVEQLHITHATPGTTLLLEDKKGNELDRGVADDQGSLVFRLIPPGEKYYVRTDGVEPEEFAGPLTVMAVDGSKPEPDFYTSQKLEPGFGYLTTRDGTQLSVFVSLPGPVEDGPYPTVVNYSGYSPSKPGAPVDPALEVLCDDYPVLCDAPDHPSGVIAGLQGFATVGVNIRGTGCSGGAFDYWEPLQILDGYDVIEVVAAQDWVLHDQVGMVGLSYPGISQLFVAQTHPPGLAAITPLSVIGTSTGTLLPGGILNNGFAISWIHAVLDGADPYGRGWEQARVDGGDTICEENQLLHSQKVDAIQKAFDNPFYTKEVVDPINPAVFVKEIDVPVLLASAWQDEQTGPGFHVLLNKFERAPAKKLVVYNGLHPDGYSPQVLVEWKAFLDIYVRREIVPLDPLLESMAPALFQEVFGTPLNLPNARFIGSTLEEARTAFEAEPDIRAIFESGASPDTDPGAPQGVFEYAFDAWPVVSDGKRLFFQPDGSLSDAAPTDAAAASQFEPDVDEGQRGILAPGARIWDPLPAYDWIDPGPAHAVAFVTEPLAEDLVMLGSASADLWIQSSAEDAYVEVNLTEVRPDGKETYVQSGWLKASRRALHADSTPLYPVHTHLKTEAAPLPQGEWTEIRVPIEGFGHVFRAGSRIRLTVDTPGGSRAEWRFRNEDLTAGTTYKIAHDASRPSSVLLPVLPGETATSPLPACPSLRGQPCRDYVPFVNNPG